MRPFRAILSVQLRATEVRALPIWYPSTTDGECYRFFLPVADAWLVALTEALGGAFRLADAKANRR